MTTTKTPGPHPPQPPRNVLPYIGLALCLLGLGLSTVTRPTVWALALSSGLMVLLLVVKFVRAYLERRRARQ